MVISDFDRLSDQMNIAFPQANVINFEQHIDEMTCHAKDRHVLAAAVECDADLIVTFNIRDFPTVVLDALGIGVLHPDDFLLDLFKNGPDRVIGALIRQCERNVRFPQTFDQLLDVLIRGGVPRFGANIRDLIGM